MHTRTLVVFLAAILVVVAGAFVFLSGYTPFYHPAQKNVTATMIYDTTRATNPAFDTGLKAYSTGDFNTAVSQLRQALTSADHASQATIKMWLSDALIGVGSYEEAIATLKSIAGDYTYAPPVRASAVQAMGTMYNRLQDPRITNAIFSEEPYIELYTASSTSRSYRKLFEYAASIYPLPLSELIAANWYADRLVAPNASLKADPASQAQYRQNIYTDLAAADQSLAATGAAPLYSSYLDSFRLRADLLGKLARIGDTSQGDPEQAFQKTLSLYAANNSTSKDAMVRIDYAGYLVRAFGSARATDIHAILAPMMGSSPRSTPSSRFFRANAKAGADYHAVLVLLAGVDSDFKALLRANGWTESDF